jgi:hypothetical protein
MVLLAGIEKYYGRAWTVLISLRVGTYCGLWAQWWTVGFHKVWGLSWPAEDLLASTGLCSVQAVCYTIHCEYTRILQAHSCKCALYGACLNITCQVHDTMSQVRPLYLVLDHTACDGRLVSQSSASYSGSPEFSSCPKTDFLQVFGSHQRLLLLILSEAHACTALQGLRWLLLVDTTAVRAWSWPLICA